MDARAKRNPRGAIPPPGVPASPAPGGSTLPSESLISFRLPGDRTPRSAREGKVQEDRRPGRPQCAAPSPRLHGHKAAAPERCPAPAGNRFLKWKISWNAQINPDLGSRWSFLKYQVRLQ
ncbi:uncharacterized protein LOC119469771 [Cebus imitator]|uniref:uncharacterized protein LOC119469771 n=1 Tax=Cebus imitator TaxID=2715852 RepID=UPI00189C477F|nr:uncharacterized protein LOC119469771 [Cebus imitator]XP_037591458.1 uncharacterized protein LOC119469771 [Cebus imitator]XP_037591462.1 uncharacterized protein LOC119469771 [Cebus imitator]